jgi:hypothetical protein
MTTDHTTADQPDDFGVPMKPGRFIHHDDGTSTFIPDQPDGGLIDLLDVLDGPYGWRADLEALLHRHVLTATLEARIAVYKQIEDNWHHNNVKTYILDLHNEDIKRLAALRDEIAGLEETK